MSIATEHTERAEPLLRFRGVTKRFGGTLAVHEIDLDFRHGEIHALLGANGAGKSTLIKLLAGVHEPDSGSINLGGERIDHVLPRPPMAFIHQFLPAQCREGISITTAISPR